MRRSDNFQWWLLVIVALLIVFVWPPSDDKSLAAKFVNWAVDPRDELPILPDPLGPRAGDEPTAVAEHDMQAQQYDALFNKGGWTRRRLDLKVTGDPFNPATERQILTGIGVLTALMVWRFAGHKK